jgi:hypothetical protein
MKRAPSDVPPERQRQFDLIEAATGKTLQWARERCLGLVHIYPMVPFVETDFSLAAWLFLDQDSRISTYRSDGTAQLIEQRFCEALIAVGYPPEWLTGVKFHYGSKETVDRDYQGSYFYFLR